MSFLNTQKVVAPDDGKTPLRNILFENYSIER